MRLASSAMTIRTRLMAIAAASLLGACVAPDDISSTTEELVARGDTPVISEDPPADPAGGGGSNGDMCSSVMCSANKAKLGIGYFHELSTAEETFPISYVAFTRGTQFFQVVGKEILVGTLQPQPWTPISGEALAGAKLYVNQVQSQYELRFTGNFQNKPLSSSSTEFVTYYEIMVKRSGTEGPTWPLCSEANISNRRNNTTEGVNPTYAALFTGDRFQLPTGKVLREPAGSSWFNVACAGSPMALMLHRRMLTVTEPPGVHTTDAVRWRAFRLLLPSFDQ